MSRQKSANLSFSVNSRLQREHNFRRWAEARFSTSKAEAPVARVQAPAEVGQELPRIRGGGPQPPFSSDTSAPRVGRDPCPVMMVLPSPAKLFLPTPSNVPPPLSPVDTDASVADFDALHSRTERWVWALVDDASPSGQSRPVPSPSCIQTRHPSASPLTDISAFGISRPQDNMPNATAARAVRPDAATSPWAAIDAPRALHDFERDGLGEYARFSFDFLVANAGPQIVEGCLQKEPRLLLLPGPSHRKGRLPIARAVEARQADTLAVLLEGLERNATSSDRAVNAAGGDGLTALHLAIRWGDRTALAALLQAGADPFQQVAASQASFAVDGGTSNDATTTESADALDFAVSQRSVAAVRALLLWDERRASASCRFDPGAVERRLQAGDRLSLYEISQELKQSAARRLERQHRPLSQESQS